MKFTRVAGRAFNVPIPAEVDPSEVSDPSSYPPTNSVSLKFIHCRQLLLSLKVLIEIRLIYNAQNYATYAVLE